MNITEEKVKSKKERKRGTSCENSSFVDSVISSFEKKKQYV